MACENALARFQKEDTTRLDQQWLDKWSKETMATHVAQTHGVCRGYPLAPIFGPLLAVTLIPFDGVVQRSWYSPRRKNCS